MPGSAATSPPPPVALKPDKIEFWLLGIAYLLAYFAVNTITNSHQFANSGITLWSPDNALSLMLIMESPLYAPIVILGGVLTDIYIHHVNTNFVTILSSEAILSLGYFVISIILRDILKVSISEIRFDSILTLIVTLPATAALTMILFCGALYLGGGLDAKFVAVAAYRFWMGDTVGMIVVIPATIAFYDIINNKRWQDHIRFQDYITFVLIVTLIFFFTFYMVSVPKNYYLFYILFLPITWVSIKYGYLGSAIYLLTTQVFVIFSLTHYNIGDDQFDVFQILMFVLTATGLLLGVVITEREHAAKLLRDQRAELARVGAQASAGAMASTLAHEISQPLSAMSIYLHSACMILDNARSPEKVGEARAALAEAEAQGKRTRAIIERIRDFVAGGKLMLEAVELTQLVEKIRQLSDAEAQERGVSVIVYADAPSMALQLDRIAIEQALNNLVTNAVDSASERGDSKGRVTIRLSLRGNFAVIDVDDNGAGVAAEVSDKLFETFETTKAHGMGLGLPLAKQVALRHSGRLTWSPLRPQGARFTLELPIHGPN